MEKFCPGARLIRQPVPEFFRCPACGEEVEIWSDETQRRCPRCARTVCRDSSMSCLEWCDYARNCVGDETYQGYLRNRSRLIRARLLGAVHTGSRPGGEASGSPGGDPSGAPAGRRLPYAERLLDGEPGDWHIVVAAAILLDAGVPGNPQPEPEVRDLLERSGLSARDAERILHVAKSVQCAVPHDEQPDGLNVKILRDADRLAGLSKVLHGGARVEACEALRAALLTDTARAIAGEELAVGR